MMLTAVTCALVILGCGSTSARALGGDKLVSPRASLFRPIAGVPTADISIGVMSHQLPRRHVLAAGQLLRMSCWDQDRLSCLEALRHRCLSLCCRLEAILYLSACAIKSLQAQYCVEPARSGAASPC